MYICIYMYVCVNVHVCTFNHICMYIYVIYNYMYIYINAYTVSMRPVNLDRVLNFITRISLKCYFNSQTFAFLLASSFAFESIFVASTAAIDKLLASCFLIIIIESRHVIIA